MKEKFKSIKPYDAVVVEKIARPTSKIDKKACGMGIQAGIIASLCCIIPLVLIISGLASASITLKFVQYKPYFIGLSIIFLAGSLWYLFRKQKKVCCPPEKKLDRKWFIMTAVGFHILTFAVLLYVLMPNISPFLYNVFSRKTEVQNNSSLPQFNLKISGMTCSSCATGIEYSLENLSGVTQAEVSFYSGQGTIIYDPNKISPKEILESEIFSNLSLYQAKIVEDKILK